MKISEEINNVLHFNFDTRQQLNLSLLRPSEFSENAYFAGRVFTLQDYIDYEVIKFGKFTYLDETSGINIPGRIFNSFYNGDFNPLSFMEQRFLDELLHFDTRLNDIYVIATFGKKTRVHDHEEAHGLYNTDSIYRQEADSIVSKLSPEHRETLERYLEKRLYHPKVWPDEMQAYLADGDYKWMESLRMRKLFKHHRKLNET